jgi:hypothetical protein
MELELATTDQIAQELRRRKQRFVLVARENTNRTDGGDVLIAGQAESALDVLRLCRQGARAFAELHQKEG